MKRVGVVSVAAVVAATVVLAGCSPASKPKPKPKPAELTVSDAGQAYLAAVCPVNEAWDEADVAVDQLRIVHTRGAAKPSDDAVLQEALAHVGEVSEAAAHGLEPVYFSWPASARSEVEEVRKTLQGDVAQVKKVIALTGDKLVNYAWQNTEENAKAASAARAALGLPEDPALACEQWDGKPIAKATEVDGKGSKSQDAKSKDAKSNDAQSPDTKTAKPEPEGAATKKSS